MGCNVVHITGAYGSGTTTLAAAISEKYGYKHLDTDQFFWVTTEKPFRIKRERAARQNQLLAAVEKAGRCVVSGSLTDWGDIFIPMFDLVIYLNTPKDIRIKRLRDREVARYGARVQLGGDLYQDHENFIALAAAYDNGSMDIRSAQRHQEWLKRVECPVVELDGSLPCEENLKKLEAYFAPVPAR
jgi:adenylate kinase family enzyme